MTTEGSEATRTRPVALVVLDGFGLAPDGPGNAVERARTPVFDRLRAEEPFTTLDASGPAVGLPPGQMGNSEVGHLNLGAGRVVQQSLSYVQERLDDGTIADLPEFREVVAPATRGGTLHLLGLVSDGGVHSDLAHLEGLIRAADDAGAARIRVHAFTDGRDTAPDGGRGYLERLDRCLSGCRADARVATVTGRYYAMDRDRRWERTEEAYRALVHGDAPYRARDADDAIAAAYARGETDEFVRATVIVGEEGPVGPIEEGDSVLYAHFRADRARQLSRALADPAFDGFERVTPPRIAFATLLPFDPTLKVPHLVELPEVPRCLAEVLADAGLKQYHAAETEKYPHVTYFFNAKVEEPFPGEERRIVPSPKVATYDLQPEMSAAELAEAVALRVLERDDDFVLVNFANPDMVGHTGDFGAAVRACEAVDAGLGRVADAVSQRGGAMIVLADHGNAEKMLADDGRSPHTAHTTNPVPCIVTGAGPRSLRAGGVLGDVAPTVLELLGVEPPPEMTGRSLLQR